MSRVAVEVGITPVQLHQTKSQTHSPERSVPKKLPHSEDARNDGALPSDLADVIFIRLPEVKSITGLSKTSIYELIREKNFPAPVRLGPRAVAWVKSEIRQWAMERVKASRSAA